jgi:uncharacterized protein YggE
MKKIVKNTILVISILMLVGCYQNSNSQVNSKSIMLKASGSVQVKPDEASASININCINTNINISKECLVKESVSLKNMLVKMGIEEKDILTTQVNLNKSHVWRKNTNVFEGYRASTTVNVMIRNLEVISEFYSALLVHENFTIGSLTYHHSEYAKLKKEAYLKALDNSNDLVSAILTKLPQSNKEIIQISNVKINPSKASSRERTAVQASSLSDSSSKQSISVSVGNMTVEQTLFVEYDIF